MQPRFLFAGSIGGKEALGIECLSGYFRSRGVKLNESMWEIKRLLLDGCIWQLFFSQFYVVGEVNHENNVNLIMKLVFSTFFIIFTSDGT